MALPILLKDYTYQRDSIENRKENGNIEKASRRDSQWPEKGRGQWVLQEAEENQVWMPNNSLRGTRPQEVATQWI